MNLGQWHLSRVLVVCFAWVLFAGIAFVGLPLAKALARVRESGSGGLGSVSFGLAKVFAPVFLPPLLFIALWLFVRRA